MTSSDPVSNNLAAIVLAAGASSRMGRLKPLLHIAGRPALERAISVFRDAGIKDVIVVLGNRAGELRPLAERCGARCVHNAQWEQGMYSSVVAGASALASSTRAAFILPADVPLVRASTVLQLAAAFDDLPNRIVYPAFDQRRGHPPLVARSILEDAARGASGPLRALLHAHEQSAANIPVSDEAIHLDMDTPADFDTLQAIAARRDIPTAAECEVMLRNHQVPEAVVRHSRKVAEVACRIANALLAEGLTIDLDLVRAAALLHDFCKGQPRHADAAAAALQAYDMARVAEIVAAHTEMVFDGAIEERAIVYLADKLVAADRLVSLDERFRRGLDRFHDNPDALAAARRRKGVAEQIAAVVEARLGLPLIAFLTEAASFTIPAHPGGHRMTEPHVLSATESLCPVCLRRIDAERVAEGDAVYLRKRCPDHGAFKTIIWRGLNSYESWGGPCRTPARPPVCGSQVERGCPFDCGLCPDHRQHTCCVVLDVTERCNLACPVCFASAGASSRPDPTADEIVSWCRGLLDLGGPFNLHLSGGEPTVRRDLPEIIRRVRALGFTYIQLNTNGVRLARDTGYAQELNEAGLTCVFLQFDGVSDDVFQTIRGKALLETKLEAIANCGRAELGVVLVPTLVPGVNTPQIGDILRTAIRLAPAVRAVHFQPVSYFGRYPEGRTDDDRITFPEVLRLIEQQTLGQFQAPHFYPASGENPYCSFHGKFWLDGDKRVTPAPRPQVSSCCGPAIEPSGQGLVQLGAPAPRVSEGVRRAQRFVAQHWSYPSATAPADAHMGDALDSSSFDRFLANKKVSLSISGMAFQDAWNLDLDRLRECFLHVLSPEQKLVPLCAYNLTGAFGQTLYRSRAAAGALA